MLNLGRVLERPYESNYNAYRRFLIANGKRSLSEIRQELRKKVEVIDTRFISLNPRRQTYELFQIYNQHSQDETIAIDRRNIAKRASTEIRNCPDCACSCFHSDFYQLTWLTHCPIHNKPITTKCPSCNQSWPLPSKIKQRKCKVCGTTHHWGGLKKANAFDMTNTCNEKLSVLDNLINTYRKVVKGKIVNLYMPNNLMSSHSSISIGNELFPSMIVTIDPTLSHIFCEYGIKLHKIYTSKYTISRQAEPLFQDHYYFYYEKNLQLTEAKECRQEVNVIINKQIINRFRINVLNFPKRFYFGDLSCLQDINRLPALALYVWNNLIEGNGFLGGNVFQVLQPPIPCLIKTLTFDDGEAEYNYNVPMEVQTIVYKFDLWRVFTHILLYLYAMRYLFKKRDEISKIYDMTPEVFSPMSDRSQKYTFQLTNDKTLLFLYADEVINFTLKRFTPITE